MKRRRLVVRDDVIALVAGLGGVGLTASIVGFPWWQAATAGLLAAVLIGLRRLGADEDEWWPVRHREGWADGARRDVARLSWSMQGFDAKVDSRTARRLSELAAGRLAERGLDLTNPADQPAIVALLGYPTHRVVSQPDDPPPYPIFVHALADIEGLHPNPRETR